MAIEPDGLTFEWRVDSYGDHLLYVNGRYFGSVYDKLPAYVVAVWGDGYKWVGATVKDAKKHLERVAQRQAKANAAFSEAWASTE